MKLWPLATPGTYATQSVVVRPRLRIATATMRSGSETATHSHPYHDQLLAVHEGTIQVIHGQDGGVHLFRRQAVIIPAGLSHRLIAREDARLITVCLGDDGSETRHLRRQPIRAWSDKGLYYLQGSGIRLAFEIPWSGTNQFGLLEQQLIIHDIDYIHPSVKNDPVPMLPVPKQNFIHRFAHWQIKKRGKVLAATYSRPNGLPSAP